MENKPKSTRQPADLAEIRLQDNFVRWVAMGEGRSFKALAAELNLPVAVVVRHAKDFNWRERLGLISSQASQRTMEEMVESVAGLNKEHVTELRRLRKRAMEALMETPIVHTRDQIKLYLEATKMERQIFGLDADSDKKDLADLLAEKMRTVQAKVLPEENPQISHEFEMQEGLEQEPLEIPDETEEGDG